MVPFSTYELAWIAANSILALVNTILFYRLNKSFKYEAITKKTPGSIRLCVVMYFLSNIIFFLSRVADYIAYYVKIKNNTDYNIFHGIAWIVEFSSHGVIELSIGYFLKIKLECLYKNTFLSVNKVFINICFGIYVISLFIDEIPKILEGVYRYYFSHLDTDQFENIRQSTYVQFSIIQIIYFVMILVLFNVKLYRFMSFTRSNNQILSSQINTTLNKAITKQTNLICIIIFIQFFYSIYWTANENPNNNWDFVYTFLYLSVEIIKALCIILTFKLFHQYYFSLCRYSDVFCIHLYTELTQINSNIATDNNNYQSLAINYNASQNYSYTNYEMQSASMHYDYCSSDQCSSIHRIIQLLNTNNANYSKITDLLNDFNHLLMYHDDQYFFEFVYNKLNEKCDIKNCAIYSRIHSRRFVNNQLNYNKQDIEEDIDFEEKNDDNHACDVLWLNLIDRIHIFYYHSYDTFFRINKSKTNIYQLLSSLNTMKLQEIPNRRLISKFISNLNINDNENNSVYNKVYGFGVRFVYSSGSASASVSDEFEEKHNDNSCIINEWTVTPRYDNLKDELINNSFLNINTEDYLIEYEKTVNFMQTDYVKALQKTKDDNKEIKELSISNILSLLIYCNYDAYQKKWSSTYRRISTNESNKSLKERHSYFYFSSLYLLNLIEYFGKILIDNDSVENFYHGLNQILYFNKTITKFYGPFSTSSEITVAYNFSEGSGLLLELQYSFSEYPLLSKYFDCSYFSNYVNEKECLFIGGIPILIITNIINVTNNNENYNIYIKSINIINAMMNGTYKYDEYNYGARDSNDTIDLCHSLLSLNNNSIRNDNIINIPYYIEKLWKNYCLNLQNIIIIWNNVFGKNGDKNVEIKCLLNDEFTQHLFFNLNTLLAIFPNIKQIDYYNESFVNILFNKKSRLKIQKILDYIVNAKLSKENNKLKYIIVHHVIHSKSTLETLGMTDMEQPLVRNWRIYKDKNKIILHKEKSNFSVNSLKSDFYKIKQGFTTKYMLKNL